MSDAGGTSTAPEQHDEEHQQQSGQATIAPTTTATTGSIAIENTELEHGNEAITTGTGIGDTEQERKEDNEQASSPPSASEHSREPVSAQSPSELDLEQSNEAVASEVEGHTATEEDKQQMEQQQKSIGPVRASVVAGDMENVSIRSSSEVSNESTATAMTNPTHERSNSTEDTSLVSSASDNNIGKVGESDNEEGGNNAIALKEGDKVVDDTETKGEESKTPVDNEQHRPFSLAVPETPTSSIPARGPPPLPSRSLTSHSIIQASVQEEEEEGRRRLEERRDSIASSSAMSSVPLSGPNSPSSRSVVEDKEEFRDANDTIRMKGFSFPSSSGSSNIESSVPLQPTASTSSHTSLPPSSSHNNSSSSSTATTTNTPSIPRPPIFQQNTSPVDYDFMMARIESQNAQLEKDPKAKRRTKLGSVDLRASFQRRRGEVESGMLHHPHQHHMHERQTSSDLRDTTTIEDSGSGLETGQIGREQASGPMEDNTDGDGESHIDWDFWGEIMTDYEGLAKSRRKLGFSPNIASLHRT